MTVEAILRQKGTDVRHKQHGAGGRGGGHTKKRRFNRLNICGHFYLLCSCAAMTQLITVNSYTMLTSIITTATAT